MADRRAVRKPHVAVLALADLGGARMWVDTEDIAMRARELAPTAFSWRKYPDQIDLDGVRVALHDAAKPAYGRLVEGSVRTGWSLTLQGVRWVKGSGRTVRSRLVTRSPARRDEQRVETRKRALERGRIRRLVVWQAWTSGLPVELRQAQGVFRVDSETPKRDVHLKVQRIVELLGEDPDVGPFVGAMADIVLGIRRRTPPARRAKPGGRRG
jgi:hypothetical protein